MAKRDNSKRRKHRKAAKRRAKAAAFERTKREAEDRDSASQTDFSRLAPRIGAFINRYRVLIAHNFARGWRRVWALRRSITGVIVFLAGVVGLVAAVAQLTGPFWPTSPVFGLPEPSDSHSDEVPFELHNPSALFGMKNLVLQCYVVLEKMIPVFSFYGSSFYTTQQIAEVGDIAAQASAQGRCKHNPTDETIQLTLLEKGKRVVLDEDDVIRIARVWVNARYEVSPWPWTWHFESSPEVFNWLELDPPRWVRGDQHEPSVINSMKEPPYDWADVRREFEEQRSKQQR